MRLTTPSQAASEYGPGPYGCATASGRPHARPPGPSSSKVPQGTIPACWDSDHLHFRMCFKMSTAWSSTSPGRAASARGSASRQESQASSQSESALAERARKVPALPLQTPLCGHTTNDQLMMVQLQAQNRQDACSHLVLPVLVLVRLGPP